MNDFYNKIMITLNTMVIASSEKKPSYTLIRIITEKYSRTYALAPSLSPRPFNSSKLSQMVLRPSHLAQRPYQLALRPSRLALT